MITENLRKGRARLTRIGCNDRIKRFDWSGVTDTLVLRLERAMADRSNELITSVVSDLHGYARLAEKEGRHDWADLFDKAGCDVSFHLLRV